MKCLTLKGALISEAILCGLKKIENRTWVIKPGWYALHTGAGKIEKETKALVVKNWIGDLPDEKTLPTKAVVGFILIGGSSPLDKVIADPWATGPICNHIIKTIRLNKPILNVKGQLGLWYIKKVISPYEYDSLAKQF